MRQVTRVVSLLWIANFVVYVCVAQWLGGDALNGHAESGHYFLAMHSRLAEVSRQVFEFGRWYTYILLAHFSVAFGLGVVQWRADKGLTSAS